MHIIEIFNNLLVRHLVEGLGHVHTAKDYSMGMGLLVQVQMNEMKKFDQIMRNRGFFQTSTLSRVKKWFHTREEPIT